VLERVNKENPPVPTPKNGYSPKRVIAFLYNGSLVPRVSGREYNVFSFKYKKDKLLVIPLENEVKVSKRNSINGVSVNIINVKDIKRKKNAFLL